MKVYLIANFESYCEMISNLIHDLLFHGGWGNAMTYDLMIVTC